MFWKEPLEVVFGQCEYVLLYVFILFCFTSLDEYSNLKAGRKENAFYDAFDAIMCHVFIIATVTFM